MTGQLHLDLQTPPDHRREDFVVAEADALTVARVDALGAGALALVGPAGAGKTHLATAWARARGAARVVAGAAWPAQGAALVDDAEGFGDEEALFHLINAAQAPGRALLLTARTPPAAWPARLPDLRSRLNALPVAELAEPDEAALATLLVRFFRARGVAPSPELIAFLLRRIERSAAAAREVVRRLDDAAHARGRPVGRGLAREVLDGEG